MRLYRTRYGGLYYRVDGSLIEIRVGEKWKPSRLYRRVCADWVLIGKNVRFK